MRMPAMFHVKHFLFDFKIFRVFGFALILALGFAYAPASQAQDLLADTVPAPDKADMADDDKGIFGLVFENDIFAGNDSDYTNGVRFSWLSSEKKAPEFARWTANHLFPLSQEGKTRISLAAGQSIFTPEDYARQVPLATDRPYAGWLYGSVGVVTDTGKTLDNMVLTVGVIGPASGAEHTQKFVHSAIGSPIPQGWDAQLENEPGIMLTYEHKWRNMFQLTPFGLGFDITPDVGFNLGNVSTEAIGGVTARLGYDLPADYGPPRIRPSLPGSDFFIPTQELGGYLFAGFEGRAVARNIFLDGNTFEDGPSVDKKNLVGGLQAGVAVTYGATRISYTHVLMTKEYNTQTHNSQFGALTLSYRF